MLKCERGNPVFTVFRLCGHTVWRIRTRRQVSIANAQAGRPPRAEAEQKQASCSDGQYQRHDGKCRQHFPAPRLDHTTFLASARRLRGFTEFMRLRSRHVDCVGSLTNQATGIGRKDVRVTPNRIPLGVLTRCGAIDRSSLPDRQQCRVPHIHVEPLRPSVISY